MDIVHKNHVARLSNLAAMAPRPGGIVMQEDDEEEDPDEVAFRERLKKLQEEEDDEVGSDPFGLNNGNRPVANSALADDKLSLDAQRAIEALRRTSLAVADLDDGSRLSFWGEENHDEGDEATFKAQQARLKALAAAAQPGNVRTQVTRSMQPKPPGLVDPDHQKRMQERQHRLSMAETAAIMAATGVGEEEVKELKPHIDQAMKAKVERVSAPAQPTKPAAAALPPPPGLTSPPGLGHPIPAAPQKDEAVPRKSSALPLSKVSAVNTENVPIKKTVSSVSVDPRKSISVSDAQPQKINTRQSLEVINKTVSSIESRKSIHPGTNVPSTSSTEDNVILYGSTPTSRAFLDVLTWRTPLVSLGWAVFGIAFVSAAFSKNWSTMTVFGLFAVFRIVFIRVTTIFESKLPAVVAKYLTINDKSRLPGSFTFVQDVLKLALVAVMACYNQISTNLGATIIAILAMSVIGLKLNIGITLAVLLFLLSVFLAVYKAVPQVFAGALSPLPLLREALNKI